METQKKKKWSGYARLAVSQTPTFGIYYDVDILPVLKNSPYVPLTMLFVQDHH